MKEGDQEVGNQNPLMKLVNKYKDYKTSCNKWAAKQSFPVETVALAATDAVQFGAFAGFGGILCASAKQAKPISYLVVGVGFITGANSGIYNIAKRFRDKEDAKTSMWAGFGTGVVISLIADRSNLILKSVTCAFLQGGAYKLEKMIFGQPNLAINAHTQVHEKEKFSLSEDELYSRTKHMLSILGLDDYEKNFKRNLLTDKTLPLLINSDLLEVKIPAGARLLILDYIRREEELKKSDLKAQE